MSAAHTPGPWEVRHCNGRLGEDASPYVIADGRDLMRGDFCRSEADARLIAAAPDLLAALQRAHWALDMLTGCTLLHGESDGQKLHFKMVCDEADKARAAIAKASEVQS